MLHQTVFRSRINHCGKSVYSYAAHKNVFNIKQLTLSNCSSRDYNYAVLKNVLNVIGTNGNYLLKCEDVVIKQQQKH